MPGSGVSRRPNPSRTPPGAVLKANGPASASLRNSMPGLQICEADHVIYRRLLRAAKLVTSNPEECDDYGHQACSTAAAGVTQTPLDHAQLYRQRHRPQRPVVLPGTRLLS